MASDNVPVELWGTILRYSISVPVFFDTNPLDESGFEPFINHYHDASPYWRSERRRSVLRRVCSGWNRYLKQFDHRFVQLEDVRDGMIPASSIPRAIRLRYSSRIQEPVMSILRNLLEESNESWALEILDGSTVETDSLILTSGRIPRLGSIASSQDIDLKMVSSAVPRVRFVDLFFKRPILEEVLQFSQVTSLSILLASITPLLLCSFPLLRHLSIYIASPGKLKAKELGQLLMAFGKNLITFLENSDLSDEFLAPNSIWLNCPNICRIQSSLCWPSDTCLPPSLHTFQLPNELFYRDPDLLVSRLPISGLKSAGSTIVAFNGTWKETMDDAQSAMIYVERIMDLGFSLYDMTGVKFQDFIVRMLRHRKAGIRRPAPGWDPEYRYF